MAVKAGSKFSVPEKKHYFRGFLLWGLVAVGVVAIGWMIAVNSKQKQLNCDSNVPPSLLGFGSCTEE